MTSEQAADAVARKAASHYVSELRVLNKSSEPLEVLEVFMQDSIMNIVVRARASEGVNSQ